MAKYELIRDITNQCSGNQMRDVFIDELDICDPLSYIKEQLKSAKNLQLEESHPSADVTIVDAISDGLKERYTFTRL